MAVKEGWSKRQLERQIRAALFERTVLSPPKVAPVVREIHPEALAVFRDSYTLEFLGLPQAHTGAGQPGFSRWTCCSSIAGSTAL